MANAKASCCSTKIKFEKWGRSIAFRIPDDVVRDYNIVPGKKCLILNENGALKIIVA